MDSFSTQITQLRTTLAAALAQVDAMAAEVAAIPTAQLVAATAPAAELPPPAPIQEQLTLGVATPATFGSVETNAQHYLLGKSLYAPTAAQKRDLEMKRFLEQAARDAFTTACGPEESVAAAKAAWLSARWASNAAYAVITAADARMERFQEYHDGSWASIASYHIGSGSYYIYRFFVFKEVVSGPCTGTEVAHWKPIGLLNPHAYFGSKLMGKRARFLDFVDASQPAPDVAAHWRAKIGEDVASVLSEEAEEEEAAFWAAREAAAAARYATPTKPAAAAGGGGGGAPSAEEAHAAAKAGSSLGERLDALAAPAPAAATPAATPAPRRRCGTPAGFACCMATCSCTPVSPLDPRAGSLFDEMNELEAGPLWTVEMHQRQRRLREHWDGRWTTLPSGERALIYHFHAFAPPADGSYSSAQPLTHLGFYNFHDRTISETTSCPMLPGSVSWPF